MDPKWTKVIAVVIVLILVVAGAAFFYERSRSSSTSCGLGSTNPLIVDQAETPDVTDPATSFTTPGWALIQQVYQGLVNYQGSNTTVFAGVLAQSWSNATNANGTTSWTFHLRPGVTFSNGDPYNAYVQWFSLYRALVMNGGPAFILSQNFWFPGQAYYNSNNTTNWNNSVVNALVHELNTWNFLSPTSAEIAVMEEANQSFQVINNLTIQLNLGTGYLGTPYAYLLATLASPIAYAVDPAVVQTQAVSGESPGVAVNATDGWMNINLVGTGPYTLVGSYSSTSAGYVLQPNPKYWGAAAAAADPSNNLLPPARASIQVNFQSTGQIAVQDLQNGAAAEASFSYLGPTTVQALSGSACVTVQPLGTVYGSTAGTWWVYMNQSTYPFNNLSVRAAVVHAIDYPQIIQEAFGGAAQQWVGPVPPGFPDYDPGGLSPYAYNLTLAQQEIANSPCANQACAATVLNFEYVNIGDWQSVATLLTSELGDIGITLHPVPLANVHALTNLQSVNNGACTAQTVSDGQGPFPIGLEFYTADYISPDDYTQNDAYSYGSANQCMSGYANLTMDTDVFAAANASTSPADASGLYANMTSMMYNNYTDAWLVVPTQYAVYSNHVHGIVDNAMGSAEPVALTFNTEYAS
ncbi:MAG TPA: ABC transporter substrate-binding protein [Thermoplasmata archaeon]|nr:ABC transporter substrate-binding protein [Thermoplasmata archaeon]